MRGLTRSLVCLLLLGTWHAASSQNYPNRPVRIIVGFGPGGPDTTARLIAQQLTIQTGQSFIVDNRPGAAGSIGAAIAAKAAPDGYTLLVASNTLTINPSVYKNLPFDVIKDLAPVSQIDASEAYILLASPSLSAQNVKELIALAKSPDAKVTYGSNGVGSTGHLVAALFNSRVKTNMVHVPYKGAGATTTALMSGEVQIMFGTPTLALPLIKSGKIRALAYDNETRNPLLPDVPTMTEAGAPPSKMSSWHGLFAPAKTPPMILMLLESQVRKAIALPEVRERIEKLGQIPIGSSSAEFKAIVTNGVKVAAEAARAAKIEPE